MKKTKKRLQSKVKKTVKKSVKKAVKTKKPVKKTKKTKAKKVMSIPKGYHNITPYLIVSNAKQAIEFYKNAFGAKVKMVMENEHGKIMHCELQIGESKLMMGDECPEMNAHAPQAGQRPAVGMHLYMNNVDKVVEKAVKAGAKITRPVANQFYGDRSGGIEDPFGHHWYVATHIEDVTPSEMKKRLKKMSESHS